MDEFNELKERIDYNKMVLESLNEKIILLLNNNANLKFLLDIAENKKRDESNLKAFKIFNSCVDFYSYCNDLYNVKKWNINEDSYMIRAKALSDYPFYKDLKNDFDNLNLVNKKITDEQVISFLDTMSLMFYMFNVLKKCNTNIYNELKIIMELVIPNKEKNRVDYTLLFRDTVILIEFSLCCSNDNIKKLNKDKKQQVNDYKEELEKYLSDKIKLSTETIIYTHDKESNFKLMNNLCDRILNTLNKASGDSFKEILKIKYYD